MTYILFAKSEIVLHRFLRILVKKLAFRLFCKSQEKVDEYQCLDKDVALESEITQLDVVSHSASADLACGCIPRA
jgi:hypothetical protein